MKTMKWPKAPMKKMGPSKKKRVATRSFTQVKRRRLNQGVHETRAGSESTFFLKYRPSKMGKLTGKMSKLDYTINGGSIITTTAGLQAVVDVSYYFDANDCGAMMTQALTQQYGGATPTGYKTERILLKSVTAEIGYNNNTNDQVRIILFDITPRRDIYNTSGDADSPSASWKNGLGDEISGGSSVAHLTVGAMPFNSEKFTHFFKVNKITHIELAPGQTHYHRITFSPNKILTNEALQQGNQRFFQGLSLAHMHVSYGAPTLDGPGTGVTTQQVKVLMSSKKTYTYTYLPNNMTSVTQSNNFSTTANANIENMVTGNSGGFVVV